MDFLDREHLNRNALILLRFGTLSHRGSGVDGKQLLATGYDEAVIPAEFEGVELLEKPLQPRQIVGAVARLTTAA